jgi:hypothetical protein
VGKLRGAIEKNRRGRWRPASWRRRRPSLFRKVLRDVKEGNSAGIQTFVDNESHLESGDPGADTALVTFVVTNPRRIASKTLFALVDVEMEIASVSFTILGV